MQSWAVKFFYLMMPQKDHKKGEIPVERKNENGRVKDTHELKK